MDNEKPLSSASTENAINEAAENLNIDNEVLNESLDVFAKTYNLTAQNVKNILYHVIKNPQTFATLFGKDPEAIASLRMTRSRQKELEGIAHVKLGIELKPVNAARTFLDVNYDDNDEDDADYRPDEADNPDDAEDGNESNGELIEEEEEETNKPNDNDTVEFLTSVDDPEYVKFLRSLASFTNDNNEDELDDDDEFNIIQQEMEQAIEEEEFRMDRTTKIPRWELEALRQDWITESAAEVSPPRKRPRDDTAQSSATATVAAETLDEVPANDYGDYGSLNPEAMAEQLFGDQLSAGESAVAGRSEPKVTAVAVGLEDHSCSLLASAVDFLPEELATIRVQMEKHVQLLTQGIIGCHDIVELTRTKNQLMEMIEELDQEMHNRDEQSSFHVPVLIDAVYSCHDILMYRDMQMPPEMTADYFLAPSPQVIWVLARCRALKYPQLVSDVRMQHFDTPHSPFFPSEQILLALALFQLFHVKHSSWNNTQGKYQLIADVYLPTRSVTQIRYHLKNLRSSTSRSPILAIIMEVQRSGQLNAEFLLDNEGRNAQKMPPIMWSVEMQPQWLKGLGRMFASGKLRFDFERPNIVGQPTRLSSSTAAAGAGRLRTSSSGTQCNSVSSEVELDDENSAEALDGIGGDGVAVGTSEMTNISEETSNDNFAKFAADHALNEPSTSATAIPSSVANAEETKQKSRRKLRVEKCMERLRNQKAREESLAAVIEAVGQDVKQRLFMHQDRLKVVQSIIADETLSVTQIFERLLVALRGEQHAGVLALIASLAPDEAFDVNLPLLHDPRRLAYKKALEMLVNSHTYLMGCRSQQSVRNVFKNIREAIDYASSEEIANRLKHYFGSRDSDPLWKTLRTQIPHEKFDERYSVEDWQFENVDIDSLSTANDQSTRATTDEEALRFESINLPYKCDPNDRGRLRLRHGRLTLEHNGRLKTVNVNFVHDWSAASESHTEPIG